MPSWKFFCLYRRFYIILTIEGFFMSSRRTFVLCFHRRVSISLSQSINQIEGEVMGLCSHFYTVVIFVIKPKKKKRLSCWDASSVSNGSVWSRFYRTRTRSYVEYPNLNMYISIFFLNLDPNMTQARPSKLGLELDPNR